MHRLLLLAMFTAGVSASAACADALPDRERVSFRHDVMPLFTRLGCNQGACHGKAAGQNGFRLSLRGYAPELDHAWLTREYLGRRVCVAAPEESLLLRKPAGEAPHGGGTLFAVGSREYQILLRWIRSGMPGPDPNEASLTGLALAPGPRQLAVGRERQLKVLAEYSDGRRRDVTWLSRFGSNDAGMAAADADGRVKVLRPGETSVLASFEGLTAVALITSPYPGKVDPARYRTRNNFIDEHVLGKLQALGLEPSELCTDAEFLRRASLDTIGKLPTPEEVRAFLADTRKDKRERLIDALLERPELNDFWALQLGDLFQNRRERDHDVRGTKGVRAFHAWLREQVAARRPWDQLAREVLTVKGTTTEHPAVGYYVVTVGEKRESHRSEVVGSVAQAFLGTRIGCAECHNHPLERYTQDDYYHFAAFFSRIKLQRQDPMKGPTTLLVAGYDGKPSTQPVGITQPRTGQMMTPRPLDRSETPVAPGEDPREKLADWVTSPDNAHFTGAIVNRVWKHYMGVGLVEPVDDLRESNPPTNPALWQALTDQLVQSKFDLRWLMWQILRSRTYQLSASTSPGNAQDTRFYSHYYARRLRAEVLLDAICDSTGVPERFPGYPVGMRAVQVPDPGVKVYFLEAFGRSPRVTACACERSDEVTLPQLLHMQNGDTVGQKIRHGEGRLARLLAAKKTPTEIVEELFLATLSRLPTDAELQTVGRLLGACEQGPDGVYRDLFWALLNSKEFCFSH